MKTIYETKLEKHLNFILPNYKMPNTDPLQLEQIRALVVIHLHYIDTVEYYLRYIEKIPAYIDVAITTSESQVEETLKKAAPPRTIRVIRKNNRGRDISSFLVACRNLILQYDYVCFTHDKKAKNAQVYKDTENFIRCIWENTLGGAEYINNVLSVFLQHPKIGLLVPPAPVLDNIGAGYKGPGKRNYELIQKLSHMLGLKTDIDIGIPFIAFGTAFWARVSALRKLFVKEWEYDDFDKEPLPDGGTISHGIERILPYVAWDAGYDTGWIMTIDYAGEYIDCLYGTVRDAFERLDESLGIDRIYKLKNYTEIEERISNFCRQYNHIYIYGAGIVGQRCLRHIIGLKRKELRIEAFLVSTGGPREVCGIPVYQMNEQFLNEDCGIIIAVNKILREELMGNIREIQGDFDRYMFYA